MIITPQIRLAIRVAATQHQGQLRHDGITPFIIHPIEVAAIVSQYSTNEDAIIAAWLHDVVEDTGYPLSKITANFGSKVAEIIASLTDPSAPNLSWDEIHHRAITRLQSAPDEAILVCLADKYANLSTAGINPDRVWYYRQIAAIAATCPFTVQPPLLKDFQKLFS